MIEPTAKSEQLLIECRNSYNALSDFRIRRRRSRNYLRNKPQEYVHDPETGELVDEDTYIANQNRVPIRINRIRPVEKNLKGQFRTNKSTRMAFPRNREDTMAGEMMSETLRYVTDVNQADELDADNVTEALLSGLWGYKTYYAFHDRLRRPEIHVDKLDTDRLFFNQNVRDRRGTGINLIGEVHYLTLDEIVSAFANTPEEAQELRDLYGQYAEPWASFQMGGFAMTDMRDFTGSGDNARGVVIEAWRYEYGWISFLHDPVSGTYEESDMTREEVGLLNEQRLMEYEQMLMQADMTGIPTDQIPEPQLVELDTRYAGQWRFYYLTTGGQILAEGNTPYRHAQHPYTLGFAELIDGEIWGGIEDIIDPQRLINRMNQSIDFMFSAGAKGVLVIPEDSIPDGVTLQEIASEWVKFNGVIRLKLKPGVPVPQQITAAAIPSGLFNWLQMMQADIKEVSGVSGPVQGLDPSAGTPARLYQQQIEQAQMTTRDLFDKFFAARRTRDLLICQVIQQYYTEPILLNTAGFRPDGSRYIQVDPARIRDIEFDVIITDAPDNPAFRQNAEEILSGFLQQNRLTFRQYLQMSSHPKAEAILAVIQQSNPLLADQQIDPRMLASLQQEATAGNPDAIALLTQAQ